MKERLLEVLKGRRSNADARRQDAKNKNDENYHAGWQDALDYAIKKCEEEL